MNQEKTFKTLEYDKITARLSGYADSESGKALCEHLLPSTDRMEIEQHLSETGDALSRLMKKDTPSFRGVLSMQEITHQLEIGASLSIPQLLSVGRLLNVVKTTKAYDTGARGESSADSLSAYFNRLIPLSELERSISSAILSEDEIADDASPELSRIRSEIHASEGNIRTTLNRMLHSQSTRDLLSDTVITTRNGRYCLPVRAEYKSRIRGMVHDQSSSGTTLFIEPESVVNLNNRLKELSHEEKDEISRILAALSEKVAEHAEELSLDFSTLSTLDFIFAKGKYALALNAMAPSFHKEFSLRLKKARHPLLDPTKVVPIDLHLGKDFDTLIITGPNTGGKTVSLKTLGLFALMAQAGLFLPAADGCVLPVFTGVFADIGDEQSIEQSLSTFSGHMTNIIRILKEVQNASENDRFLILFDELCSGTDPLEGAALATSILEHLRGNNTRIMATTHYSELKSYALSAEGVENAACEFDVDTLSPTYRLLIGIPGKSNAFAISEKLGLPTDLIDSAKEHLDAEHASFEDMVTSLEQQKVSLEKEREKFLREKNSFDDKKETLRKREARLEEQKDKILRDANEKASNILRDAKESADAAIRNINKYGTATPDMSKLEKQRQNLGKKLNTTRGKASDLNTKKAPEHKAPKPTELHLGDRVKVLSLNLSGTVHTLPDAKGNLEVQMGIMSSKVKLSDVVLLPDEDVTFEGKAVTGKYGTRKMTPGAGVNAGKKSKKSSSRVTVTNHTSASAHSEIMLLGMTSDEAVAALDKYLDEAYRTGYPSVRIVHGKGTGALRKAVHNYLRTQPHVEEFHLGEFGEGDAGVTIARFRE